MKREHFETYYNGSIEVIAKRLCEANTDQGFSYVRNLDGVYEAYLNQWHYMRHMLKNELMRNSDDIGNVKSIEQLDGHKLAACITVALTQVRLITNANVQDDDYTYSIHSSNRLNEQMAVLCGIGYLVGYMIEKESNKTSLVDIGANDNGEVEIIWPETDYNTPENPNHYIDSLIRGVYYSSVGSHTDPILLAHIYFFIEQYHRKSVELNRKMLENNQSLG